jgi:hypothetical protein
LRSTVLAGAAVATVATSAAVVTVLAAWMVHSSLSGNTELATHTDAGPRAIALAPQAREAGNHLTTAQSLNANLARAYALAREIDALAPRRVTIAAIPPHVVPLPPTRLAERVAEVPVPLPLARPALPEVARAPAPEPAPAKVAVITPPVRPPVLEKRAALPQPKEDKPAVPAAGGRTAVYDIAAHTVYLPNGRKLEAHSGIGERMDDPHSVRVRMRGPTPPNEYRLTLREQLFHGVRAIRLNPVNENKMFGRDGMLAHTYMLGPSGQSNGCVSFKHYDQFLQAYLDGEIDRLIVVPHLGGGASSRVARIERTEDYAYNN